MKQPLTVTARWVPSPDAEPRWCEAISLLAEGFAELHLDAARREVAARLCVAPEAIEHRHESLTDELRLAADPMLRRRGRR